MDIDSPENFDVNCLNDINAALVDLQVLAARIAILRSEGASYTELLESVNSEALELGEVLRFYKEELVYTFSGQGFSPIYDEDAEAFRTAYIETTSRGKFSSISLLDPVDLVYLQVEDDEEDDYEVDDDMLGGGLAVVDTESISNQNVMQLLRNPRTGPNLYMEFSTGKQSGIEQIVGGIAVRSFDTEYFNVMDLSRLTIDQIEILPNNSFKIGIDAIVDVMLEKASLMVKVKRDTRFRRTNKASQLRTIDTLVESLNLNLGLERVQFMVETSSFYVPVAKDRTRRILKSFYPDKSTTCLRVRPVRVDCIDSFNVRQGERIHSDAGIIDTHAGLYLVGTLDEGDASSLELPTNVIWIPLGDKGSESFQVIPNDSPK